MSRQHGSLGEEVTFSASSVNFEVPSIRDNVQVLLACKENGGKLSSRPRPSIYTVPTIFRNQNPNCFMPLVVSIGLLHKKDKSLQEFEEWKMIFLDSLLGRLESQPEKILESCLIKVNASIGRIKACYAFDGITSYTDGEVAKVMVMDACFILEFIRNRHSILKSSLLRSCVFDDLILLENQIPFFVLQDIFDCTLPVRRSLTSFVLECFEFLNPFQEIKHKQSLFNPNGDGEIPCHVLGLIQASFHPENSISPTHSFPLRMYKQSVIQLDKAGVKFKPNEDENWQLSMKFISSRFGGFFHSLGNPTLKMPVIKISDGTERYFRNIIAYEQCTQRVLTYFTSYAAVMDTLVDTTDDILKLEEAKVIVNNLGSNEEAKNMINGLCTCAINRDFYYAEQWQQLDSYCNGYWPKNIAKLKRLYFNSPWNIIALVAGFILFSLTMVQTIFTIKGTYSSPH